MQKTESQHGIEARELQKTKVKNRTWNRGKTITEGKKRKTNMELRQDNYRRQETESQSGIEARRIQKPTRNQGTTNSRLKF